MSGLRHPVAFVLVVGVERHQAGGDRYVPGEARFGQGTVGVVGPAAYVDVRALDAAAGRAGRGQQVQVGAVQAQRFSDPQARTGQQPDQEPLPARGAGASIRRICPGLRSS
ncbi:hypothetical protein [Streptomyces capoamus]|uniref:hypothetical protein n=1 Tax=Streptomyces capoamus TaxID=68183 RepID=UPI003397E681